MKKLPYIKIILVITIFFLVSIFLASCANSKEYSLVYTEASEDSYASFHKIDKRGKIVDAPFTVLTSTDLHLHHEVDNPTTIVTLSILEAHIQRENPDLVVLTGDICLGERASELIVVLNEIFQRNEQYYAVILGNHDGEKSDLSRKENIEIYSSYEYCINQMGPSDIYGYGNFIVNIIGTNNKINNTLVFMDSGDYITQEKCDQYGLENKGYYDFIKPDQIEWYKDNLTKIISANDSVIPKSALFIHIPLPEYDKAYSGLRKNPPTATLVYPHKREFVCCPKVNSGMFDAILELDSTKFVICGHDHINSFCVEYQGVKLTYSQSLSYGSYFMRIKGIMTPETIEQLASIGVIPSDGTTLVTLTSEDITPSRRLNQEYPEVFKGLEDLIPETAIEPSSIPEIE